jgi:hypothetical protein
VTEEISAVLRAALSECFGVLVDVRDSSDDEALIRQVEDAIDTARTALQWATAEPTAG